MKTPVWLHENAVLVFHEASVNMFGGSHRIRDLNLLRSALDRPKNRFTYEKPSMHELAASYAFGIVQNHPFIDGNKRTGFLCAVVFLERNGHAFEASEVSATIMTLDLASGKISEAQYAIWIEQNSKLL